MNADFLRSVLGIRRRSVMTDRPISYSNFTQESNPQRVFEQTLATVINEPSNKKIGLTAKYLEMSTLSAIIEVINDFFNEFGNVLLFDNYSAFLTSYCGLSTRIIQALPKCDI